MTIIDINNKDYYFDLPNPDRIRKRLIEIKKLGLEEIGNAQFGIKDLMSGLYIEMLWNYSEEEWNSYIHWIVNLKEKNV